MKIPLNDILVVYEKIVKGINVAEISMILFVALDVDALCTLRILSTFLKNENINYKIYPVASYTELEGKIEDAKIYQKVKLFFFINCGGLIDLTTKWFAKQAQVFLFDINKPMHHANIEGESIKIIDDEFGELKNAPTVYQVELYQNVDDQFVEEVHERQLQNESDDDIDIAAVRRKRHKSAEQAMKKLQKIRKIKSDVASKVQSYYQKQFFSLPSSYIAYRMIKDLNKSNNNYLWFAIVGLTSMFLQMKLQKQQYESITSMYRFDAFKYNKNSLAQKTITQKNSITEKADYVFPLMRHWSLYDSIMNSSYMISKLQMWNQIGIKKLHQLISLIGLSLQQSKQLYKYMSKSSVTKLQQKILTQATSQKFALTQIKYQSFIKQIDYAFCMTASDFYYVLATVLERPSKNVNPLQVTEHRIQCFWQAYQIFSANQAKFQLLIQEAKKNIAIYIREARNIIDRNHAIINSSLSFVNLLSDTEDRKIFEHPNSLTKLSYILMQMINSKKKKNRPFLASLQNNANQTAQLVGIMNESKNSFSSKFNMAIVKHNVDVRMDSFMSNIMTIPKQSLIPVVREISQM